MNVQNKSPDYSAWHERKLKEYIGITVVINENILSNPSQKYKALCGKTGVVRSVYDNSIGVEIDGIPNRDSKYGYFYFKTIHLNIPTVEKENEMNTYNTNAYKGKFRVVTIQFLDNDKYEINYRLYDDGFEYKEGDMVVVKSAHHGWTIAKIKFIFDEDSSVTADENREIICPIDTSKFLERDQKAKEISKLKREMDKKVKELQGIALYEVMAQHSPELRDMLIQFKELTGVEASADKLQNET